MATVTIRNLDEATVERLKSRAKLHDRSLESELRQVLSTAANGIDAEEFATITARIRALTRHPLATDSAALIREDRRR
jgi:antitoxin FitA